MNIKYLNHASVLIEDSGHFLLLDPWHIKPSFGSWLSAPPSAINPVYLAALAKSRGSSFSIVISHGHDDHCDNDYLQMFPKQTTVIIPKFAAPGLRKRIENIGFKNILEVGSGEIEHGVYSFRSFVHHDISHDDAIVTIRTKDKLVVHANDNWKKLDDFCTNTIKSDVKRITNKNNVLLMSQCNLADGFPYCYTNFSREEQVDIANNRIITMTNSSLDNAESIGAKYFLNYAGHTKIFVEDKPDLLSLSGFKSFDFIKNA